MDNNQVVITEKDLNYICDIFNWNLNIYKTCQEIEGKASDSELKELINEIKSMHKESAKEILGVINNG